MLTLAVLAGGSSSRMGKNKALLSLAGKPLVEHVLARLASLADEVILSTNAPTDFAFLGLPMVHDLQAGQGALGGLYAAMKAAAQPFLAAVACDMPFASRELFEYELELIIKSEADLVIPSTVFGLEPLHAIYHCETCLPHIEAALAAGDYKLSGWTGSLSPKVIPAEVTAQFDPKELIFANINTPEDFHQAEMELGIQPPFSTSLDP
jgi:molybdopterin-guanine dinucleotide biosynthesis protein A